MCTNKGLGNLRHNHMCQHTFHVGFSAVWILKVAADKHSLLLPKRRFTKRQMLSVDVNEQNEGKKGAIEKEIPGEEKKTFENGEPL